jgi:signal transduction histidine kinase/DNA-binding response OmpR family regulator/tetratricopeptide (TPR) repeat protein
MKNLTTALLFFTSFYVQAQNTEFDSLYHVLESHPQQDTIRFRLLMDLSDYVTSHPSESKAYLEQALTLAVELEFKKGTAEAYCSLAYYYWDRMDYQQAIHNGLNALREYETVKSAQGLYETYSVLAGVYTSWKDFKKAGEYMAKMEELVKVNENLVDEAVFYHSMGFFSMKQNKLNEGVQWISKALSIFRERGDFFNQANCYFLLAKAQEELGDKQGAITYYQKSIQANKLSNHPASLTNTAAANEGMAKLYIQLNLFHKASLHLDTALQAAEQIRNPNMIIRIFGDKVLMYEAIGNFKEALKYERLRSTISDSVFNTEKSEQVAEAQAKYEAEKKEQTINLLEKENKIKSLSRNLLVVALTSLMLIGGLVFYFQRQKNKKSQELLQKKEELNRKLLEADHLKSRFFTNISHEFRTPLTLILGPVEEKLSKGQLTEKDKVIFQTLRRSANRLLELINQILELSKLESGYMKLKPESAILKDALLSIACSFDSLADVNQVHYTKDIAVSSKAILFDRDKLEKMLANLLSNAFKFTPRNGQVAFRAIATESETVTELRIEVQNTGAVISQENLEKIFDPFFQGATAPCLSIQGSGLGLSLVKEIVKLHNGSFDVSSDSEIGTVFKLFLKFGNSTSTLFDSPRVEVVHPINGYFGFMDNAEAEVQDVEEDATDERGMILIVEDNTDVRAFIRSTLEPGYSVQEASTGEDGLRLAMELVPQLIIVDVMMPGMTGMELCLQLKTNEKTSHIPVILLTARADHESRLEGLRTGADDYLIKPFNGEELRTRVLNLIEQRLKLAQKYSQRLVVHPHEITVSSLDEQFIHRIMRVVESHLDNTQLNMDMLTSEIGMSRTNLHRKLKALTGFSASEFIQDFRLRRAAQLIEKKANTISQIAYEVGFGDQSYFTKCFKKKFGRTPSEFVSHS